MNCTNVRLLKDAQKPPGSNDTQEFCKTAGVTNGSKKRCHVCKQGLHIYACK